MMQPAVRSYYGVAALCAFRPPSLHGLVATPVLLRRSNSLFVGSKYFSSCRLQAASAFPSPHYLKAPSSAAVSHMINGATTAVARASSYRRGLTVPSLSDYSSTHAASSTQNNTLLFFPPSTSSHTSETNASLCCISPTSFSGISENFTLSFPFTSSPRARSQTRTSSLPHGSYVSAWQVVQRLREMRPQLSDLLPPMCFTKISTPRYYAAFTQTAKFSHFRTSSSSLAQTSNRKREAPQVLRLRHISNSFCRTPSTTASAYNLNCGRHPNRNCGALQANTETLKSNYGGLALFMQRRCLGNEVTGPQFDLFDPRSIDLKTEAHYAGRMFFNELPSLSYWDFQQTCASLRVFLFLGILVAGAVDFLIIHPLNSSYWSLRWSPLRWPRALQLLFFPSQRGGGGGDIFTYTSEGEYATPDGSHVHTEACATFLSLVYGCCFPPQHAMPTHHQQQSVNTPLDNKQPVAPAAATVGPKRGSR